MSGCDVTMIFISIHIEGNYLEWRVWQSRSAASAMSCSVAPSAHAHNSTSGTYVAAWWRAPSSEAPPPASAAWTTHRGSLAHAQRRPTTSTTAAAQGNGHILVLHSELHQELAQFPEAGQPSCFIAGTVSSPMEGAAWLPLDH